MSQQGAGKVTDLDRSGMTILRKSCGSEIELRKMQGNTRDGYLGRETFRGVGGSYYGNNAGVRSN
jgi:hypothetical protein